jgi:hypothetical protein
MNIGKHGKATAGHRNTAVLLQQKEQKIRQLAARPLLKIIKTQSNQTQWKPNSNHSLTIP